jgi:hypothetical protein
MIITSLNKGTIFRIFAYLFKTNMAKASATQTASNIDFESFKSQVLADYKLVCESRETSLL